MSIKVTSLVWQNYCGSGSELLTLLALADRANDEGGSLFMSMKAIAKKIRLSESQARKLVHNLLDQDYLKVVKNNDGGRNSESRHYQINVILLHVPIYKVVKSKQKTQAKELPEPMEKKADDWDDWEDINFSDYGKKEVAVIN